MKDYITIIGGGLAGCEAAYQIAKEGIKVKLYEMKPIKYSEAHSNQNLAEIVCSNSFKSNLLTNACGLLKEELRRLDSLLIRIADETQVPAGQALAVDRELFAKRVTEKIEANPLIEIIHKEVESVDSESEINADDGIVIIATGPLTSEKMAKQISKLTGEDKLYFYDAAAPIISKDSINFDKAFYASRYNKGEASYINCPMNKDEYEKFYNFLINAPKIELKEFEKNAKFFESCLPVEVLASRGVDTLRFGPMKPVGLVNPTLRCSDDGEPGGTAGRPMLDVITGAQIHNICVVVTRYFGGTLLGTGGLVRAYSGAVKEGLKHSVILHKKPGQELFITCDYNGLGKLQYLAVQNGVQILDTEYTESVTARVMAPEEICDGFIKKIIEATGGKAVIKKGEAPYYAEHDGEILLFSE